MARAKLSVTNEEEEIIKMSAIGKYPFFTLTAKTVNFEDILIQETIQKEIEIINQSEVGTFFEILKIKEDEFDD